MHSTSDHTRQKETGAYYTPPAAVAALVKWLLDESQIGCLTHRAAMVASSPSIVGAWEWSRKPNRPRPPEREHQGA